jgi:hypothetical protein
MIFSISFFNKVLRLLLVVAAVATAAPLTAPAAAAAVATGRVDASPAAPGTALAGPVRWSFAYAGEPGGVDFTYTLMENGRAVLEHVASEPEWVWYPRTPGNYQLKVTAVDGAGVIVASGQSAHYRIAPAVDRDSLFAVLPAENLSGVKAPLAFIGDVFSASLAAGGLKLLGEPELQDFLRRNRVRYTGGIGSRTGQALKEETGSDAVFVLSVETYQQSGPPKISLIGRLVLCGERPEIAWMDSVGMSGDEAPGLLGLGLVSDDRKLMEKAVARLIDSFVDYLEDRSDNATVQSVSGADEQTPVAAEGSGRFLPKTSYRSSDLDLKRLQSVAVLPFTNRFARKNSGQLVPLYLIKQLMNHESIRVIEPGLVREALLQFRIVMEGGPSLSVADIMSSESVLDADLLIAGSVFDYQSLRGEPKVHFSVQAVETRSREVVWWSNSYAAGGESVLLFNVGRIYTAHGLVDRLAKSVVSLLVE